MLRKFSKEGLIIVDNVSGVPPAIGHYSHMLEVENGLIYLSGQKAWDPKTGRLVKGDVQVQTMLIFDNIERLLHSVGLEVKNIVRIQCHLAQLQDYDLFNEVYTRRLGLHKPARTTLAGYNLRGGALIELVAEAYRPSIVVT